MKACFPACAALLLASLALLLASPSPAVAGDKGPNFVQQALEGVTIGEGVVTNELIIFPLIAPAKAPKLDVMPASWAKNVGWSEPEFPKKRYNVGVANNETKTLLVLGGTLLGGGNRDRMFPQDVLVPVGGRVEVKTIVASSSSERRKDAVGFRVGSSLAAPYLRERAEFHPTNTLVPNFVSHFLDFRNEGDKRRSLSAINASTQLTKLCLSCHESLASFPMQGEGHVVGVITAVRTRIRSLEMFGTNRLLKAYFEPLLKSLTFAAAAIAVKAKKLGVKDPNLDDPDKTVPMLKAKAQKLLDMLKKARFREGDRPKGSVGEHVILRTGNSTRGAATALDGRLVHLSVFPYDPFENAMFSTRLRVPSDIEEYGGLGLTNLAGRRARGQRLTEYEKRVLDGARRGRTGLGVGGTGGGAGRGLGGGLGGGRRR